MPAYRFAPVAALNDVADLRAAHRKSLTALPELFVEMSVRRSSVYAIESEDTVGYLAALKGTLIELFLVPEHRSLGGTVLIESIEALDLKRAWASTFDPIMLAACSAGGRPHKVFGLSFRTLHPVTLPTPAPLPTERLAMPADVDQVRAASHPEVFTDDAEVAEWVNNGWVTLFEVPEGLAGFGLCTPTGPDTLACDVGVRVGEPYQRRGLGAWIVQRMAAHAHSQGLVPTAGCGIDNAVSRRTLERAGFVADHRLLQFDL